MCWRGDSEADWWNHARWNIMRGWSQVVEGKGCSLKIEAQVKQTKVKQIDLGDAGPER